MKPISLIPFVCGAGASTEGSEQGPIDLLQRGLQKDLQASGADVEWVESPVAVFDREHGAAAYQDLPALGTDGRKEIVMHHCCYLRDKVVATINQGRLPITLGGDHSMAAGSIAGLAQARQAHGKIGVIWIDAHADINTPENSASKALHGMPVAALLGMGDDDFKSIGGLDKPVLEPHHIFYLGLRDVETAEQEYLDELGIQALTNEDIEEYGVEAAVTKTLDVVTKGTDYLVLSIDLDGLDPQDAPATGTPVDKGIRLHDMVPVLTKMIETTDFDLLEIAEYNPTLDGKEQTYQTIKTLLELLISKC